MLHNKTLVIVGGGPRGLACAIEALNKFRYIYIIDEYPTDSWNTLSTVADFELRSPISFDLVTYSNNKEYSLSKFIYDEEIIFNSQKEIEEDPRRLNRSTFYKYLCWIKYKLQENNVNFIYNKVLNIYNNNIELTSGSIKYDYVILAQGTEEKQIPTNLKPYKRLNNYDILNKDYSSILIVGSGQGAYDIASYLYNKGVNVGIYISKYPKIDQYPAPSYSAWKERSALGNYCSSLLSSNAKLRYIKNVKDWGPSITPNNEYLLNTVSIHNKTEDIKDVISNYNNTFISRVGVKPINTLNIKLEHITTNFRLINTNIFISGPLAILYDGPRNNSIISSSSTAIKIMEEIEKDASI